MEINKVIQLIRELTKKTVRNGCTEAEALAAANKIGELLKIYNLSMSEVFLEQSQCITQKINIQRKRRHPVDLALVAIAEFCDCYVWFERTSHSYCFFGLEPDTQMATYLYHLVLQAIETETQKFKQSPDYVHATTHRKKLTVSFQKGMATRIAMRLQTLTKQRQINTPTITTPTGTSLIAIKQNKVQSEYEKLSLSLRKCRPACHSVHYHAYHAGAAAAESVHFNRPLPQHITGYLAHET